MGKPKARELVRFGEKVRKLRDARDWTQEQLAEKAGLDQASSARSFLKELTSVSADAAAVPARLVAAEILHLDSRAPSNA